MKLYIVRVVHVQNIRSHFTGIRKQTSTFYLTVSFRPNQLVEEGSGSVSPEGQFGVAPQNLLYSVRLYLNRRKTTGQNSKYDCAPFKCWHLCFRPSLTKSARTALFLHETYQTKNHLVGFAFTEHTTITNLWKISAMCHKFGGAPNNAQSAQQCYSGCKIWSFL